jgi:hypothetical protein
MVVRAWAGDRGGQHVGHTAVIDRQAAPGGSYGVRGWPDKAVIDEVAVEEMADSVGFGDGIH